MEEEKNKQQNLLRRIDTLSSRSYVEIAEQQKLEELKQILQDATFTVVVIGEFSRGKSTFINALIGQDLIPMDVLPEKAVIHAISYGKEPALTIIHRDGTKERGEASQKYLQQFVVGQRQIENVSYLKIACPSELLAGDVMLVDTPGVSDMDEQRAEITYGFLPQADIIIMLLDATAPLKKTEKEFIEKRVLPQGIKHILFVANKADNIDEEEVPDNYAEFLKKRIDKAFGEQIEVELFLMSSKQALIGALQADNAMLQQSGLIPLANRLNDIFAIERQGIRSERMNWQYQRICGQIYRRLSNKSCLAEADETALEKAHTALVQLIGNEDDNRQIEAYVAQSEQEILKIIEKSLTFFHDKLHEEVMEMVMEYRGQDFKKFVEGRLQRNVEREIENWIALYSPRIEQLIAKMKGELAQGIARKFRKQVIMRDGQSLQQGLAGHYSVQIESMDISNTDVKAGAIAALGGIGLTLVAGSALMPFVSFAAMPLIRRQMLEVSLEKARAELIPDLEEQLRTCFLNLLGDVNARVHEIIQGAIAEVMGQYRQILQDYRTGIETEIEDKQRDKADVQRKQTQLEEDLQDLKTMML